MQKRKLRVAAVRRMPRAAMEDNAQEPDMSFAKAIVVVVVLHLVAVGGIYAFSSIKARNLAQTSPAPHPAKELAAPAVAGGDTPVAPVKPASPPEAQEIQVPVKAPVKTGVTDIKQAGDTKPAVQPVKDTAAAPKDSGAVYTVAKGDNPVAIAKKLHVNYDELLKLNKITDPKKLQVGQKLRIPASVKKKPTPQT